jgi:hypothetical protein
MKKIKVLGKSIPLWLLATMLCVGIVAAYTIISNTWISPKITVTSPTPKLLSLSSPDLTQDQTLQVEESLEYNMTLENPNTGYTYTGVHVIVEIRDLSDNVISPSDVTVQYYDPTATPGYEWKTITFEQGNGYIYHDWSGANPFNMPPGSVTILFRVTFHTPGQYQATAYAVQGTYP